MPRWPEHDSAREQRKSVDWLQDSDTVGVWYGSDTEFAAVASHPTALTAISISLMSDLLHMSDPLQTRASLIHRLPNAADVVAWDEFVAIYGPLVYRLARRKGLQQSDADDLVQEVLSAVAQSVHSWLQKTDRGKFRAWLFRIARNKTINFLTRRKHRPVGTGGDIGQQIIEEATTPDDLSAEFEREYRQELFRSASRHIRPVVSEQTWEAFRLTAIDGCSVTDAANTLKTTAGCIYVARSRVMARLRDWVQKFEESAE